MRNGCIESDLSMRVQRNRKLFSAAVFVLAVLGSGMSAAHAQTSGKLRMVVDPGDSYEFVVDHQFRMQEREVELTTGPHHFSFWAPQRMVVDTTLLVEEGRTKSVMLYLPYAKEYLVYQRELQQYQRAMRKHRVIPMVATGGAALFTVLSYSKARKAHNQLEDDRTAYEENRSPTLIGVLKDQTIPDHKDDFKKANTQYLVAAGVTALFAGATVYLYHMSGKINKPTYIDKEKLRFDGLSWMPGPQGGTWMGGITWNIAR